MWFLLPEGPWDKVGREEGKARHWGLETCLFLSAPIPCMLELQIFNMS